MNQESIKEKLKIKLREIFQLEDLDLDFGIYRIMKYKKDEIEKFIEKNLIKEVEKQLDLLGEEERKSKQNELDALKTKLIELGVKDYANNEKYKQKLEELKSIKSSENLEREIYNHIYFFFSRYYDKGDFISKRKYGKEDKYYIPYNGEEVKLHWANFDQYYIKTTEFFKKYFFKVADLDVNFRIIEAEEEKGNIKSPEKKYFLLCENKPFEFNNRTLNIFFEYRGLTDKEENKFGKQKIQDKINIEICEEIKNFIEKNRQKNQSLLTLLKKEQEKDEKTLIEKKLYHYTRRNTSDYFIHKNLKSFLERELDFYIKSEVINLDDVNQLDNNQLNRYILQTKVIKNIANKIIEFLSQIENFQKKIWEKKKFVLKTEYVITLDKIKEYTGEEFLEKILDKIIKNKEQLNEWKELFGIEIKNKNELLEKYEKQKSLFKQEKTYKKLPIDTKYFDDDFKWQLIIALSNKHNLDDILEGLLIKSENYQALNLILEKHKEQVQTIYIDPPFNKENEADYLYKVGYKDASWITLLENRLQLAKEILKDTGSIFVRCDYNGNMYVRMLMNEVFGEGNYKNEIILSKSAKVTEQINRYHSGHDSLFFYTKSDKYNFNTATKKRENQKWRGMHLPGIRWSPIPKEYVKFFSKENLQEKNGKIVSRARIILGKELLPPDGRHWALNQRDIFDLEKEGKIKLGESGEPQTEESDFQKLTDNWTDWVGYSSHWGFTTENHEKVIERTIQTSSLKKSDIILDFFHGSGTTTAVAHKLGRKWIGIEMGEHFWTVILPRMKKVLFYDKSAISKEKDVKERYNEKLAGGFFKYLVLEQYEDALENIEFKKPQQEIKFEDYLIKYILDSETKDSQTFLNIDNTEDPFNYQLKIIENYKVKTVKIDLPETYNYLIGLKINKIKVLENKNDSNRKYLFITGERKKSQVIEIYRCQKNLDPEKDRDFIQNNFDLKIFDEVHINGDSVLSHPNIVSIETEFKKLLLPSEN